MIKNRFDNKVKISPLIDIAWDTHLKCVEVLVNGEPVRILLTTKWVMRNEFNARKNEIENWVKHGYDSTLIESDLALEILAALARASDSDAKQIFDHELKRQTQIGNSGTLIHILLAYHRLLDTETACSVFRKLHVRDQAHVWYEIGHKLDAEKHRQIFDIYFPNRYPIQFEINEHIMVAWDAVHDEVDDLVDREHVFDCILCLVAHSEDKEGKSIEEQAEHTYIDEIDHNEMCAFGPKELVSAHASNVQTWVKNDYNPELLYSKIAVPLLKALARVGDVKAKEMLDHYIEYQDNLGSSWRFDNAGANKTK